MAQAKAGKPKGDDQTGISSRPQRSEAAAVNYKHSESSDGEEVVEEQEEEERQEGGSSDGEPVSSSDGGGISEAHSSDDMDMDKSGG